MIPNFDETIVALSSAAGPGGRAIIRLSGPEAVACAVSIFTADTETQFGRGLYQGSLRLPGVYSPLPADLYFFPAPGSYTGQDLIELHTFGCPPLVELAVSRLLAAGARAAGPGEFTMRRFLNGKLDLTRVEAVAAVIEAADREELKQALAELAGGMSRPLEQLREDLLNLLADVEAGLDFSDEDLHFVSKSEIGSRLSAGLSELQKLQDRLESRSAGDRPFRVVLVGLPNAGKSSLFNALTQGSHALVSPVAGTTRDYLIRKLQIGDVAFELVDTAGWETKAGSIDSLAHELGKGEADRADLLLHCCEPGVNPAQGEKDRTIVVLTKADLGHGHGSEIATSVNTSEGLDALLRLICDRVSKSKSRSSASSLSRSLHHISKAITHLEQAMGVVDAEEPSELLALEIRGTLDEIGELVGAVYTDDLLDRVFSRFCIGK